MLSSRLSQLRPSGIRAIMALAAERQRAGKPTIHLEVGQPVFPTPMAIIEKLIPKVAAGLPGYTPNLGMSSLREAVASRTQQATGIVTSMSNVGITAGAVNGLALAILAVLEPGHEVLAPDPGWPNYFSSVALAGGRVRPYRLLPHRGYQADLDDIEAKITGKTKILMINFPGNPTGGIASREHLEQISEIAAKHNLYILSDEVYEDFIFDGKHTSVREIHDPDKSIVVSGASKSFSMTGWRIGWIVAPEDIVSGAGALAEPLTSCPSTIGQVAAEIALSIAPELVAPMRDALSRHAELVSTMLDKAGLLVARPRGAFYTLVDVSRSGMSGDQFARSLLESTGVAVAPGETFGDISRGQTRLSFAAADKEVRTGCQRLIDCLAESQGRGA